MNDRERSGTSSWRRHPTLTTLAVAGASLAIGVVVLLWHIQTSINAASGAHGAAGDVVFFIVIASMLLGGTAFTISRQRRS